eukprot:m.13034 g.13034  ORF g.13034 m.13034 type:complete len:885 (+) comp4775_c0_seq1:181-2835(+)
MSSLLCRCWVAACSVFVISSSVQVGALHLDGDTIWVVPPELAVPSECMSDYINDTAQALAYRDVELDWYKVLGYRALIYTNTSWANPREDSNQRRQQQQLPASIINSSAPIVFFGDANRHPYLESTFNLSTRGCGLEKGDETHCILLITDGFMWEGIFFNNPALVVVGNGTRGSVYAAYSFSEHVLGVAPFHLFTFDQPSFKGVTSMDLEQQFKTPLTFGPPTFTHRAIFLNDEELLGFFRRDPLGEQVFDMVTVDAILQTLLRSKGNTIIMGTTPYPDEKSLALAARRGVILTASHFEILGFNAFAWSRAFGSQSTKLWDWTTHPDVMGKVFEAAIQSQKNYDMIWSIGLRGLNDYAYPNCLPDDAGPMGCGTIISQAVANQTALLVNITGVPIEKLSFKFNLWSEALAMYQKGLLKLPPQTKLIVSDSGAGFIRGDDETFAHADGVYYHVQMLDGHGGQITEFVPPSRIFEQLSFFKRMARSTGIFVLNLSDLKPALLTAAAALSFVWDASSYEVNSSSPSVPNRTAAQAQYLFLTDWATQNFNGANSSVVAQIALCWQAYFSLPWIGNGGSDEFLAGTVGNLAEGLAADVNNISAKTVTAAKQAIQNIVLPGLANATKVHEQAMDLVNSIPSNRLQFYKSHLLVQSAMQRYFVEAISHLSNATLLLANNTASPAAQHAAMQETQGALNAFESMMAAQRMAEGTGEWRGMYWGDRHRFTNVQARRRQILRVQAALSEVNYAPNPMIDCCQMEYAYQWSPQHLASYPLLHDDPVYRCRDFVLVSCANATTDGGRCQNAINSGLFSGPSAEVELSLIQVAGDMEETASIKYTTDGSDPSTSSSAQTYSDKLIIKVSTTLRAVKISQNGSPAQQQRLVTFTKSDA